MDLANLYTKTHTALLNLFRHLHTSPNKLGYIVFTILSYSLYLDWIQVRGEFSNSLYTEAKTCKFHYEINSCDTPTPAMVMQCIEWYTCTRTHNIPGTLIWAEVIKR